MKIDECNFTNVIIKMEGIFSFVRINTTYTKNLPTQRTSLTTVTKLKENFQIVFK